MQKGKVLSLEDRIPKIKEHRRRKANKRLISLLSLFFLLIVLVVYFQSPLSHIKEIDIQGNKIASKEEILSISGLKQGENIWKINKKNVKKNVRKLPVIKDIEVKMKFPNIIQVHIVEYSSIALLVKDNQVQPVLENGRVLEKKNNLLYNAPILTNFKEGNVLKELTTQLKNIPKEIFYSISEIQHDPKKTDPYHIYLFMNDGNEVNATIPTLAEKMAHYPSVVGQLDPNTKGVIDFEVGSFFKAYETEGEDMNEEGEG
ncbi:FtsQ-type POTRA domain-containing protein [Lederbergia sp. NSJ-179]|uniref:cell division protein FtsQ/DivIB n=1 Tax=Lederbergia sp. NSJ-179 TaxID=2931402 RepID=UPI001FD1B076|nr:FtsQ-type POTRA domain-containing protein [Lederbergia sp. NSJ-179]MCJ7839554.1 FtsQ-type POTRA domain-containing protein [Lederbergia sp. NSJ-179]